MAKRYGKLNPALLSGLLVATAICGGVAAFVFLDNGSPLSPLGPEYTYDLSHYRHIDPTLMTYQPHGPAIPTGLTQSRVMTLGPNGWLWVAGDKTVIALDSAGNRKMNIECPVEPLSLAFDDAGLLYVGLMDHIGVYDAQGHQTAEWTSPHSESLLTSLAVLGEFVFAADAGNKMVWRFAKDGSVSGRFGQKDPALNHPGFQIPSPYGFNLAAAPDGLLRIVNPGQHWIEAWTPDGHREWWWGQGSIRIEGFSGCCNPAAIAMLPDGHVITSEKGLVRVKEYDAEGHLVGVVAGPEQLGWVEPLRVYDSPEQAQVRGFGVAVDGEGRVYVLDVARNVVLTFEKIK